MQWLSRGIGKIQRIMCSPKQCYLRVHWMGEKMPGSLHYFCFEHLCISFGKGREEPFSFFLLEFVLLLNFRCKIRLTRTFLLKTSRIKHKSQYRVRETILKIPLEVEIIRFEFLLRLRVCDLRQVGSDL